MAFENKTSLYVEPLPDKLTQLLNTFNLLDCPEFINHTIIILNENTLRHLFSAHLNARNQACGALMQMMTLNENISNEDKWFILLGILQRENQYMHIIADFYNRTYASK